MLEGFGHTPEYQQAMAEDMKGNVTGSAFDIIDAISGGLASIPKGLAVALADVGMDLFMGLTMEANENNDYLKAMYIGPKGMKALGIDVSKDLAGQFTHLGDKIMRARIEVPKINKEFGFADVVRGNESPLGEFVSGHEADVLFKAYPELKNIQVEPIKGEGSAFTNSLGRIELGINPSLEPQAAALAHETQHAIQGIEGMPRGGAPDRLLWARDREKLKDSIFEAHNDIDDIIDARNSGFMSKEAAAHEIKQLEDKIVATQEHIRYLDSLSVEEKYHRLAGENEARDTAVTHDMPWSDQIHFQPGSSYDINRETGPIPLDKLIYRY